MPSGPHSPGIRWFESSRLSPNKMRLVKAAGRMWGANQAGPLIETKGWTDVGLELIMPGRTIEIQGVGSVSGPPAQIPGYTLLPDPYVVVLASFRVIEIPVVNRDGGVVIAIAPAIVGEGQYQNVNMLPANDARVWLY